jgi:hypothetical protein
MSKKFPTFKKALDKIFMAAHNHHTYYDNTNYHSTYD